MINRVSLALPALRAAKADGALTRACGAVLLRAFEVIEVWAARIEQRRQLASLDARMLRDIGRSEADVVRETAKPFWKA